MNNSAFTDKDDFFFNTKILSLNVANQTFEEDKNKYFNYGTTNTQSPVINACNITEQYYQLHMLKQQQQSGKQKEQTYLGQTNNKENVHQIPETQKHNGLQYMNSREQYDIDNYEPPQYESWEEDEDLDVVIDLNRSNSFNSGIFQFETNNSDYILNSQLQSWKL